MATFQEHLQKHSKKVVHHIRRHHRKYIFGIVWWAIAIKLALTFIASIWLYEWYSTFAQELTWENQGWTTSSWENQSWNVDTWNIQTWWNLTWNNQTGSETTWWFTQESQDQTPICSNSDFNFINPLSWSKLKWTITFSRTYIWTDCSWKNFDIYLRDHNSQWIKVWTSSSLNTRFQFNSSQLYSWFYNILSDSWNIIYTWQYTWLNSKHYTGYKIKFLDQNQNIVYTWNVFTIDNQLPAVTWVAMEFTWNYNLWYIGLSWTININFTSTEDLTGVIVNILWREALFVSRSWLNYKYSIVLSSQNTWDAVYSNISFADFANNTWSKYLTSQVIFDKTSPALSYILLTWTYTGFDVLWSWKELTKYELTYTLSWTQTWITLSNLTYMYTGSINITWLNQNQIYNFIFKLIDPVNNVLAVWGKIFFTTWGKVSFTSRNITGYVNSGNNMTGSVSTWSTWGIATISNIIKQEIDKFNSCKEDIEITAITIQINGQDISLNMPNFGRSDIRKIVNSFAIVVMDKLEKSNLTKDELDDIIDRFDDFLIILKLVRDDENQCKQNLSNYHIRLFQKTLKEYNISI